MRPRDAEGIPALTRPATVFATSFSGGNAWYRSETAVSEGIRSASRGASKPVGAEDIIRKRLVVNTDVPKRERRVRVNTDGRNEKE